MSFKQLSLSVKWVESCRSLPNRRMEHMNVSTGGLVYVWEMSWQSPSNPRDYISREIQKRERRSRNQYYDNNMRIENIYYIQSSIMWYTTLYICMYCDIMLHIYRIFSSIWTATIPLWKLFQYPINSLHTFSQPLCRYLAGSSASSLSQHPSMCSTWVFCFGVEIEK